jgi:hypothetical protein
MLWITLQTNDKRVLLIESNIMCYNEDKYLHLFTEEMGITARTWTDTVTEIDKPTYY